MCLGESVRISALNSDSPALRPRCLRTLAPHLSVNLGCSRYSREAASSGLDVYLRTGRISSGVTASALFSDSLSKDAKKLK